MSEFWLSRSEVRELDDRAAAEFGVPSIVLMENAGRGAAELLMRLNSNREPVAILCGPGNNGGDGFVMARHLDNHGWPVHVWLVLKTSESGENDGVNGGEIVDANLLGAGLSRDARANFHIALRSGIGITVLRAPLALWQRDMLETGLVIQSGWIVDALFGTGLKGEPGAPFNEVIAAAKDSEHPVLAVDIPSGLDCDEGEPMGETIRAAHTATFVGWKKGFVQPQAKPWLGEVHVIDIGAPKKLVDDYKSRRQSQL